MDLLMTGASEHETIGADYCNDTVVLEAEICGLCMELVIDRGLLDCCQHWFCFACIDNWATITNLCPLCQKEFQLITCVPVYDTVGSNQLEEELLSREDDWSLEEKNNTISFPSYYIDENAVACLDGNGCKIRTGTVIAEDDSSLDTSIACDSCDIWYHAFCVGFDSEGINENSWLCPRCAGETLAESVINHFEPVSSSYQENANSLVENSSGRKLSVSVADAGETAIVVSIITGDHSIEEPDAIPLPTIESTQHKTETIQDEHSINSSLNALGKIDISRIKDKPSDGASGVDPYLEFSLGSSSTVNHMKICGTDNVQIDELASQSPSDNTLGKEDQEKIDLQDTIAATKRRRTDLSDGSEESKAKTKTKTKPKRKTRYAKRSKPEGKFDPEQDSTMIPEDNMLQLKGETSIDIMSIVQRDETKPLKASSLRVKKIMRRSIEDSESSEVVQKLRKEIREAVRNRPAEELGQNLFDPKLLAAFRAVISGPKTEQTTRLSPLALKAKKSLLQKGKVRESLTKKIYGSSNGRRKRAWDRDCEVEFWKYRCTRTMRPEKIETLKSVLSLLRNGPDNPGTVKESEMKSENSILSRLYLADTSVFPRKDDIRPISNGEDATEPEPRKGQSVSSGNTAKQFHSVKSAETREDGSNTSISASIVDKSNTLLKMPVRKQAGGLAVSSLGTSKGSTNIKKEITEKNADVKTDKRKWALDLLARKTAAAEKCASSGDGDTATLKGNYPLLAQLPVDMRPTLAPARHNKIPLSVRQMQLYRLAEHFLKKANPSSVCRNAETELAIADAVNIEKTVADRSSSKLVYVNLCSQELSRRLDNIQSSDTQVQPNPSSPLQAVPMEKLPEECTDKLSEPNVEAALRATGLISNSPPSSPNNETTSEDENQQNTELSMERSENILELDNNPELDIYGDFEYDLGDEDYVGATVIKTSIQQPAEGESKMKVVFSTLQWERSTDIGESTNSELIESASLSPLKNDKSEGTLPVEGVREQVKFSSAEGDEEPSAAECEELYGPDKEPLVNKFLEGVSENEIPGYGKSSDLDKTVKQSGGQSIYEKSAGGEKSHGDSQSRINTNREIDGKVTANIHRQSSGIDPIAKKVEAYIKEHIRPLCKSGVISPEQYRWAVSKSTDKIMKYHSKAKNANFLIKEGEKVKRLAEQYVEAAQNRPKDDS
ncbi:hypothetical protein SAY87_014520 [Trapa incisa]|uniref:Uncharacterized protein n=1 Tax=Trapa incisa TaxID=236973 RepID=A0AAN7GSR8_9MYRT|nr:hypothetical protein SAY87_014520 [Trapa incisa]